MNVKVHTPKSLKTGSGMSTLKQFLLSLVATTISIILTFGTASWVDSRKKESAKHEMVMMILYDLAGTLDEVEYADSLLHAGFEQQLAAASQPEFLAKSPFMFYKFIPKIDYTETVERIFSSNIETINTIGNVEFAENVSSLYLQRKLYSKEVCDSFTKRFEQLDGLRNYDNCVKFEYGTFIYMSGMILKSMRDNFSMCKHMMRVSDTELEAYRHSRHDTASTSNADSVRTILLDELKHNNLRLEEALKKSGH